MSKFNRVHILSSALALTLVVGLTIRVAQANPSPAEYATSTDASTEGTDQTFMATTVAGIVGLVSTTIMAVAGDAHRTQSLADQAAAGSGDDLVLLARVSKRPVSEVADIVIEEYPEGDLDEAAIAAFRQRLSERLETESK